MHRHTTSHPLRFQSVFSSLAPGLLAAAIPLVGCAATGAATGGGEEGDENVQGANGHWIDMAEYVIPSCGSAGDAVQIGSEQFRVVPAGMHGGRGRFAIVKSTNGEGFEEWWIDADYLRIRSDTTWAYEAAPDLWCDVKCGDNGGGNCQQRWNTDAGSPYNGIHPSSPWAYTVYHDPGDPGLAAPWIPRKLELAAGEQVEYTTTMMIKGAERDTCAECWVNFNTPPGSAAARTVRAARHASWNGYEDVVQLHVQSGPGAGEQYFYARGRGWVGFNDTVASGTVPSSAFPASGCADMKPESICEATGGPVSAPAEPPAEPLPSGGSCPCRGDVDNYCLYPKSETGCVMLQPFGYCDPNGDGELDDADWVKGYYGYHDACQ